MSKSILEKPLSELALSIRRREISVSELAREVIKNYELLLAEGGANTFTQFRQASLLKQARRLDQFLSGVRAPSEDSFPPTFGIPFSIKDIFNQRGWPTTAGSSFLAKLKGVQDHDSAMVSKCRRAGVLFSGKTHLNEFAYGITGENRTWGDCHQPRAVDRLTGGSSSGAAASVLAGTAVAGLGTDTGGSIRVPSALCGLVGVRLTPNAGLSLGMIPLAPSFDSAGWVQRHLADVAPVYTSLFRKRVEPKKRKNAKHPRFLFFEGAWLNGCEARIHDGYLNLAKKLEKQKADVQFINADFLSEAAPIFTPIQAYEAARYHLLWLSQYRDEYDPAIRARLDAGASIPTEDYFAIQAKRRHFVQRLNHLFKQAHFLVAPASPVSVLTGGEDHSARRAVILQITTPFSLGGMPVLTIPERKSITRMGWQFIAPRREDLRLMELSLWLVEAGFGSD